MPRTLSVLFIALTVCNLTAQAQQTPARPNIVFLLIDDLGFADVGFNGGTEIHTPHIDALAASGAILDAHYVQPVCSPTRAALMTGRYATRTGVYTVVRPHARWGLPLNERTLASALHAAGYETAIAGKWHLGEFERAYVPTSRGFDHQYGHYFGAIDYFTHVRDGSHDWYRNDQELREDGYSTHLLADEACRRIAERDAAKPLFLYVPFNGVHSPHQVPESYLEPYGSLTGNRRQVAGMLAAVDEAIGRIVTALDAAGMKDNTLIVFSSDNGGPNPGSAHSNGPFRAGKGTLYEGGIRVAACASWPGHIAAGRHVSAPIHMVDWYPSFVTLAGGSLEQPLPIDGLDVTAVLTTDAPSPHDAILHVQSPTRAAIRMGDWKLLRNATEDAAESAPEVQTQPKKKNARKGTARQAESAVQLFNLAADPGEASNVAAAEPDRVASMTARLDEFLKDAVPPGQLQAEPSP